MPSRKSKKPPEKHRISLSKEIRTTTIRVDDDLLLLIQEAARRDKIGTADVIRNAITNHVNKRAQSDAKYASEVIAAAQQRHERAIAEISQTLGPFAASSVTGIPLPSPIKPVEPVS